MKSAITKVIVAMDRRMYVRMLVCLLPGIVAGKLSVQLQWHSAMATAATLLLLAGTALLAFWDRLMTQWSMLTGAQGVMPAAQGGESFQHAAPAGDEDGATVGFGELVRLYGGSEQLATRALLLQSASMPDQTTADAIASAVARRRAELAIDGYAA